MSKILIVDDEKDLRDLVAIYLKNDGFEVTLAKDGVEAIEAFKSDCFDAIILDVMMPNMNGIDACLKIRESSNIPIIMLSAKNEDMDKILGLTTGADDYLSKPFNPLELIARVKALIRRSKNFSNATNLVPVNINMLREDDLVLNLESHKLLKKDVEIKLTPTEFSILQLLWENKGIVFSTDKIYERVWGENYFENDNTVMVHIRKIREKIEDDPRKPQYLLTVWGVGYKFGDN